METNSLGVKLKDFRDVKGISQSVMVEKIQAYGIDMKRETLSKIENNNRNISADELNAICNVLDIDMSLLFEEESDLVSMFRARDFSEDILGEIEEIQNMVKIFISQKKIFSNEYKALKVKPLWEDVDGY